jgi:hypothetical protein
MVTWRSNSFNIQKFYILPTLYLCVLYLYQQTVAFALLICFVFKPRWEVLAARYELGL